MVKDLVVLAVPGVIVIVEMLPSLIVTSDRATTRVDVVVAVSPDCEGMIGS